MQLQVQPLLCRCDKASQTQTSLAGLVLSGYEVNGELTSRKWRSSAGGKTNCDNLQTVRLPRDSPGNTEVAMCHCEPSEWNEIKMCTGGFACLCVSIYFDCEHSKGVYEYWSWPDSSPFPISMRSTKSRPSAWLPLYSS